MLLLMTRRPPTSTRTDTLCPYTTLVLSAGSAGLPDSRWKRRQPRTLADAPESMDPRLRGDDGQRLFRSAGELLGQHPLLEVVLGIEQQGHRAVARLADHDLHHVAHLVRIGGRADRPLVRIEHGETDLRFGLEHGAAPA